MNGINRNHDNLKKFLSSSPKINSRKTFEEGDEVIVKGVEREGTVNKRRGDYYNVTLDATGKKEKNNVFVGDMVRASRQIKSSIDKRYHYYSAIDNSGKKWIESIVTEFFDILRSRVEDIGELSATFKSEGNGASGDLITRLYEDGYNFATISYHTSYYDSQPHTLKVELNGCNGWRYFEDLIEIDVSELPREIYSLYSSFMYEMRRNHTNYLHVKNGGELENGIRVYPIDSSRQIKSRFYMDGDPRQFTLSEVAQYLSALFFDLRTIHFNTTGSEFYTYHKLAEELYEKTEDYYDDIVETAINFDSDVSPMYVLPGDWIFVEEDSDFSTENKSVQTMILERLKVIYDVLEKTQDYDSMVSSKLDGMMEYYDKEIYKLSQALK